MYFLSLTCLFVAVSFTNAFNDTDLPDRLKAIQNYGVYYTLNSTVADFKPYNGNAALKCIVLGKDHDYEGEYLGLKSSNCCYGSQCHLPFVKELLREVGERYREIGQVDSTGKKHPFIAVEGVHRKTRNIVGLLLSRRLGADVVYSPPEFMVHLGANITDVNLRKAFFGLTGYVAACTARHLTKTLPAVVSGHWMSQAAFAIAKVYDQVPPPESQIYSWPLDLYPPDIVFFINSRQKKERRRNITDTEFLEKFVQVYRNWRKPPVFEISNTYQYGAMTNKMIAIINQEFQGNY